VGMINFAKKVIIKIFDLNILKQEALLRMSLKEHGVSYKKCCIKIDHVNGKNYVNNVELDVVYPMKFMKRAKCIADKQAKTIKYYFNGNMADSGKRKDMLSCFANRNDSILISSNYGRQQLNKFKFNDEYFSGLASATFGLCPHQADWTGPKETMWTYRFIECCMTKTIPILFRDTPLGEKFTEGFFFLYNDELDIDTSNLNGMADANYIECIKRFTISDAEINQILAANKNEH
jgi:hypothetical protein